MHHRPNLLLGLALAAALPACGGGEDDLQQQQRHAHAPTPQVVSVRGCVVDRHFIPHTATPVRALSADGRLLASALSDAQGRFTLQLPAHSSVTLAIDRPGGEVQTLQLASSAAEAPRCLLDEQA